ncbi:hypothetical protein AC229_1784 [Oenococcus oeni]|nr:hypothetical protein AC229_1784 [Oenococcus oeni]
MRETTFLFRFFKVIDINSFKEKQFLLLYISSKPINFKILMD